LICSLSKTNPDKSEANSFLKRLVTFGEILRQEQFGVTPSETIDAAQAVLEIDISNIADFHNALKCSLVKQSEDYARFDQLFKRFWLSKNSGKDNPLGRITIPGKKIERTLKIPDSGSNKTGRGRITAGSMFTSQSSDNQAEEKILGIYSPIETTSRKSFRDLKQSQDRALLKRALRSFARATATIPGRRLAFAGDGTRLDFRRTFRSNMKSGGHAVEIELLERKISKSRLVVLCDISGSMDSYSERVLKLIYYLSNTIRGSQVYGFSTKVVPLNRFLQGRSLKEAARLVSENVDVWSSGTRIGSAIGELISNYSGVLRSSTVFVVISDGWELGDLDTLKSRLNEIQKRVSKVIWLNPQADSPDYVPLAEGMKNALPYLDVFAGLDIFSNRVKFRHVFKPGRFHT
jgi:uncharacterized protein with von Willebrand factor type A (vWA) domain